MPVREDDNEDLTSPHHSNASSSMQFQGSPPNSPAAIENLLQQIDSLQLELLRQKLRERELLDQLHRIRSENLNLQMENAALTRELNALRTQIKSTQSELTDLKAQLEKKDYKEKKEKKKNVEENDQLKKQVRELRDEVNALKEENRRENELSFIDLIMRFFRRRLS